MAGDSTIPARSSHPEFRAALAVERETFRRELPGDVESQWQSRRHRVGVVLSGGGARGAYEAGVLLAFQDARMPTHIIAATSIGSINAAFYAAHSATTVGNAEPAVEAWLDITPTAVGIDWFRYILVLAGLTAVTAGIGNLFRQWAGEHGVYIHLLRPKLTWVALALTGAAVLFYYDKLSYLFHVARNRISRSRWKPDSRKTTESLVANVVVWSCAALFLQVAHLHVSPRQILSSTSDMPLLFAATLFCLVLGVFYRKRISEFSHDFLRLPLRSGLFPNFERTRFLRERIPARGLRNSPIRVAMTAAEVSTGTEKCFTNATESDLLGDPGADSGFVTTETSHATNLLLAVIASSAFPIVYEAVPMQRGMYTDGGIVSNQPIRPALRLGADILFLVMMRPGEQERSEIKTFLDLGIRAIDILTAQNLKSDLKMLKSVNRLCAQYASQIGLRPEQVQVHLGEKSYRYMKAFTIAPSEDLAAGVLDFEGALTAPAILQGYRDGQRAVRSYLSYLAGLPLSMRRETVKLVADGEARREKTQTTH